MLPMTTERPEYMLPERSILCFLIYTVSLKSMAAREGKDVLEQLFLPEFIGKVHCRTAFLSLGSPKQIFSFLLVSFEL